VSSSCSRKLIHCKRLGSQISDKHNSLVRCWIQQKLPLLEFSFNWLYDHMQFDLQIWMLQGTYSRIWALSRKLSTIVGDLEGRFGTSITHLLDVKFNKNYYHLWNCHFSSFLMGCDLTYKYETHNQHYEEFKHWCTIIQATRANWVDETWEGLAINILDFINFNWGFLWKSIWYVLL
jgi:hypothetical protein